MRKPPDIPPPATITPQQLDIIEQIREYKLITPLYGGGVTPDEFDPVTVVRSTEIRGHLRFWWRATRGGLVDGSLEKLKMTEDAIWGKAHTKEQEKNTEQQENIQEKEKASFKDTITIEVVMSDSGRGEARKPFNIIDDKGKLKVRPADVPEYAVFPLRPLNEDLRRKDKQQIENEMKEIQHGVSFILKIVFPRRRKKDVEAALWAWETFGGIGARTRRGFGALQLLKINGAENTNLASSNRQGDVRRWLIDNLREFVVPGIWPARVPHLEQTIRFQITNPGAKVFTSWNNLIKQYASFRQDRAKGNTGRSNWPEAETIRNITDRRYYTDLHHPQKFPRAAFGLPIIFHFKDSQKGDPQDTTLQGAEKDHERFASPLILRPLICKGGLAVGLAVLLKGSEMPPLVLKELKEPVEAQLSESDLALLPNLDLNNQIDVLQAFMDSLGG